MIGPSNSIIPINQREEPPVLPISQLKLCYAEIPQNRTCSCHCYIFFFLFYLSGSRGELNTLSTFANRHATLHFYNKIHRLLHTMYLLYAFRLYRLDWTVHFPILCIRFL